MKKILAFLQNPGFPEDTHPETIRQYNLDDDFRRKILKQYMTGQRLLKAFGEEVFDQIVWDNVILQNGTIKKKVPPDMDHIRAVIAEVKPDIIITFGAVAYRAIKDLEEWKGPHFMSPHPNARGITSDELALFADLVLTHARRR